MPTQCRSCGAEVTWLKTKAGKNMICEAAPVSVTHPPEILIRSDGETINYNHGDGLLLEYKYYRPHWARCPQAKDWRKSKNGTKGRKENLRETDGPRSIPKMGETPD